MVYRELAQPEESFQINGYQITAFKVNHNILCYGYAIEIARAGRFLVERAQALGIPKQCWNRLQKGMTVEEEGKRFTPDQVMGPPRKGLKVTYCTDSRPTQSIVEHAFASDLFICEGMYAEKEKEEKAKQYKHMTFYEAARMARDAKVSRLWLTHFSPSLVQAESYMGQVREVFPGAALGKDGKTIELDFEQE